MTVIKRNGESNLVWIKNEISLFFLKSSLIFKFMFEYTKLLYDERGIAQTSLRYSKRFTLTATPTRG